MTAMTRLRPPHPHAKMSRPNARFHASDQAILGIEFAGSDAWQIRLDARVHATGSTVVGKASEQEAEATLAFTWRFGGDRKPRKPVDDEDEDGILDAADRCPFDPETPNGA